MEEGFGRQLGSEVVLELLNEGEDIEAAEPKYEHGEETSCGAPENMELRTNTDTKMNMNMKLNMTMKMITNMTLQMGIRCC
jgi:hypothetical protein